MRYTIDTTKMTININEDTNINELVEELKVIKPDDWKKYKIANITTNYYTIPYYSGIPFFPNPTINI